MEEEPITRAELARALGVHRSTITRALEGRGGKNLLVALQRRYPDRANDLVKEHHEVAVVSTVSVESGTG
jgi:hypothetical protein